jgi:hypothetical protein
LCGKSLETADDDADGTYKPGDEEEGFDAPETEEVRADSADADLLQEESSVSAPIMKSRQAKPVTVAVRPKMILQGTKWVAVVKVNVAAKAAKGKKASDPISKRKVWS